MVRVLTAARVTVDPEHIDAWLDILEVLAARLKARGQHLWVFRAEGHADRWLEFTEGPDPVTHRSTGPADDEERILEASLRELAGYDDESTATRWQEISLTRPGRIDGATDNR
ncbi:MAG: hypothetical protein ABIR59_12370 [Gemmatimonadales bacterium]